MPKKPDWEKIRQEWEANNITLKALAEKHGVKLGTLKSRKSRGKWTKVATLKKKVATKKGNKKNTERPVIENDNLTDKQRLFCLYYLKYFNATKAYRKAYECAYSTAMVNGHKLLRNAKVSDEIDRLKAEQANEVKLDVRDVLQKYIDIAFADIADYVEFGKKEITVLNEQTGKEETAMINRVDFKESTDVDGTIITEVKQGRDGISVKLADKMKALEMLSKYFDLLSDNDKKRLQDEKLKAETELTKERTKLIKGEEKDLSLLEELFRVSGLDE